MILYIETNTLIGAAKGQLPDFAQILAIPAADLTIAIPSMCIFEALVSIDDHFRRERAFASEVDARIRELRRDPFNAVPRAIAASMEQARLDYDRFLDDVQNELLRVIDVVGRRGVFVELTPDAFRRHAQDPLIDRAADNLILSAILQHLQDHPQPPAALLTGNTADFATAAVRPILRQNTVEFFSHPNNFLGWFNAHR